MKFKHLGLALVVLPLAMALGVQGTVRVAQADSPPNCIRVLASFFAPIESTDEKGLKAELAGTRAVAEFFQIPTGVVISRLTKRTGDVNTCLGFLFGGG